MLVPMLHSKPRTSAMSVVEQRETTKPRTVLEDPNTGCPSGSLRPPSIGAVKRSLSNLLAKIGLPLAAPSRSKMLRSCGAVITARVPGPTDEMDQRMLLGRSGRGWRYNGPRRGLRDATVCD